MPACGGGQKSEKSVFAGACRVSTGAGRIDLHEVGLREIAASVEPAQRDGKAAARRGGLAHDVSNLPGVGRHVGSQLRANTSITIMRAPQRGQGQRSVSGASGAISDCCCGSTAGGATLRNARAVTMFSARLALAKSP